MSQPFLIRLKIVPLPQHPAYYHVSGAYFDCSVYDETVEAAVERVRALLTVLRWEIKEVRDHVLLQLPPEISEELHVFPTQETSRGEKTYKDTYLFGISYLIHYYSPGGEDEIAALKP